MKLINQTQSMLDGIAQETLLSYHVLSDYKKIMVLKFLAKLESSIQQVNPALLPFVTIKIVEITMEHGLSPMSAIGFAYFGGMIAELGDIRCGYRYTKLAKALLDKHHCNEIAGEVLLQSVEILSYMEPLQSTNEYRIQAQAIALAAGDVHWACMNKVMLACTLMWSGANLVRVKDAFTNAGHVSNRKGMDTFIVFRSWTPSPILLSYIFCTKFSEEHGHRTSLYYMKTFDRTISRLIGDESQTLSDEQLTRYVIENKNPHQLVIV
jgi:hypothetical protein